MSVQEFITETLRRLEQQFYAHLPRRDYKRDEAYLIAAIGTYGWECHQRGWEFDLDFIYLELCRLLQSFKKSGTEITWMPNYLQNAIRQHIREHAEELKAQARSAKSPARLAKRIMDGAQLAQVVIEPSPTQQAAYIYRDVRRLKKAALAAARATRTDKKRQTELLIALLFALCHLP